ncbi:MAG TPA: DUF692 family protein [Verrucomicrobiae bacterium]|nr:DUF692 family protein [Verrucomicrobiae bacterium]
MKAQQDNSASPSWPVLGCGVGLRSDHYNDVLREWPKMDWFEAVTENYMDSGGRPLHILEQVRRRYPVALHGVSLSIGSMDPLHPGYLQRLKALVERIEPFAVSDHLCWSGIDTQQLHDLLPLPYTEESVRHVVRRVDQVQELLRRPILLENVSTYVTYKHSTMKEWDFLSEVAARSGCGILLDLNNIYVNSRNHGFDPKEYLDAIDGSKVAQYHLAGHTDMGDFLFDTHTGEIINPVWDIYKDALARWGKVSTLIEWDEKIEEYSKLSRQAEMARALYDRAGTARQKAPVRVSLDKAPEAGPSLLESQRWMKSYIQPHGSQEPHQEGSLLNRQGRASGEERMDVYAGGYAARMRDALDDVYEALNRILGEKLFWEMAQAYAAEYPSQEYNLSLAGRHLPEFLQKQNPITAKFPFLPDLAALERLVAASFHAFDEKPLAPSDLAGLSPDDFERIRIFFQPSVAVMKSAWPVCDLWEARNAPAGKLNVPFEGRPQNVLVGRRDLKVHCQVLDGRQVLLLELLLSGKTLGEACEILLQGGDEPLPVSEWFAQWMAAGFLRGYEIAHPADAAGNG